MVAASTCHGKKGGDRNRKEYWNRHWKEKVRNMRNGRRRDRTGRVLVPQHVRQRKRVCRKGQGRVRHMQGGMRVYRKPLGKDGRPFESAGIPLELANPLKTKAIAWASIKNDTIDARTLAHLLRAGLVAGCYIGSAKTRGIKQVLRYEMSVVQDRTAVINFVHTLTDKYDIDPKNGGNTIWREKTLKYLDAAQLKDPYGQFVLDQCISRIRYYNGQIRKLDGEIARYVKSNYMPKLLLSMTGIDVFSTALLAAEIDDIAGFGNPKRLVSWAGMCPTPYQSGDTSYHGRMKKDSNRKVNWIMIQCTHVAVMHDDRMKAYYGRLKKRNRPSVAITHVANKMLTVIWHMLTRNELYRERNEDLYRAKIKKVMAAR